MASYSSPSTASTSGKVPEKYKDDYKKIKSSINAGFLYFRENNERFHYFNRFVNKTSLNETDTSTLQALQKPLVEFNIVNACVSRLAGEYSKQMPAIYVRSANGEQVDEAMLEVIEGHIRHVLDVSNKKNTQYNVYQDQLGGGFSGLKVFTDYENEMSFDQEIFLERPYEPTFVVYDPMARDKTKSDAKWFAELFPMTKDDFKRDYPKVDISDMAFLAIDDMEGLSWSYSADGKNDVILVAHYYELKTEKKTIIKLSNGQILLEENFEDYMKRFQDEAVMEVPPIKESERETDIGYFCRYTLIENQVIEYRETDFKQPCHIFVDGDSRILKEGAGNGCKMKQFTKPYIYHAKGIQQLTNFAGQVIANDFENMVMHKFMIAAEALPQQEEYLEAYSNVQKASVLVWQAYNEQMPEQQLPPPQPVPHIPLPPSVENTFNNCMNMLQNILGAFDSSMGIENEQLSGIAIVESATQSNAAAMPYIVSNMAALTQAAQVIVDLIPKVFVTPRTVPIIDKEGHRQFVMINQDGSPMMQYNAGALKVTVDAGPSFAIEKNRALKQITALMQASPVFAQFMNEEGLEILLDNMSFAGVDIVKKKAAAFMEKTKQMAAAQAQQQAAAAQAAASQPNAQQTAAEAAQMNAQAAMIRAQTDAMTAEADIQQAKTDSMIEVAKIEQEKLSSRNDIITEVIKSAAGRQESQNKMQIALMEAIRKGRNQEHVELVDIIKLDQAGSKEDREDRREAREAKEPKVKEVDVEVV